jgi:hypothetical protein
MAQANSLTPETFLAVTEMIAAHLRIKEADRWSPHICRLKFHSFTSDFPEVNEPQFMWAAEQWIQTTDTKSFLRYPAWSELMAPLYRTEAGRANRSWGPRPGLPKFVQFKPAQLDQLPQLPASIHAAPDPANAEAYALVQSTPRPALPPAEEAQGLTDEQWQAYLQLVQEEASCSL